MFKYEKLPCQQPSPQHITSLLKKISAEVIHPHVSKLPGLVLLVVLAVHSAADHQNHLSKNYASGVSTKMTFNEHHSAPV